MKNNTGDIDKRGVMKRSAWVVISLVLCLCLVFIWSGCKMDPSIQYSNATIDAELELTQSYGKEVAQRIENFQSNWDSLEVIKNPDLRKELAVSPFVDEFIMTASASNNHSLICDTDECLVVSSVNVEKVRVLEYSEERFKAIGCATALIDKMTPKGEFIESLDPYDFTSIYVFVLDGGSWKLSGLYNVTIPQDAIRDWDFTPEWLKQSLGDLPVDNLSCDISAKK